MIRIQHYLMLTALIGVISLSETTAQEILLNETPAVEDSIPGWGPNRKHNLDLQVSYGLFLQAPPEGTPAALVRSNFQDLRVQYKNKLSPAFAALAEGAWGRDQYLTAVKEVSLIDGRYHEREYLRLHLLEGAVGLRINPDIRRGNIHGQFVELALFGNLALLTRQVAFTDTPDSFAEREKTIRQGVHFLNPYQHGWMVRLGWNQFRLYYRQQLSDVLNDASPNLRLPDKTLGISFSLRN